MKKLIFSALVATALCLFSCGKDDDNGGGSTSLNGDWYLHTMYNNSGSNGNPMSWAFPDDCAKRGYRSFSDTQIKEEWYHLMNLVNYYKLPKKLRGYAKAYCQWYEKYFILNK